MVATCFMSRAALFILWLFGAFLSSAPSRGGDEVLIEREAWDSPDGQFTLLHMRLDPLYERPNRDSDDAAYVLVAKKKGEVLWAGRTFVDSSAHDFIGVWSPDSKRVLILDRPQRALVGLFALSVSEGVNVKRIDLEPIVARVEADSGDTSPTSLTKMWFAKDWKWIGDGKISGSIMAARSQTHRIKLLIDFGAECPEASVEGVEHSP